MRQFITRVELHNATYKDYEVLHAAMLKKKFHKAIKGDNGISYQLPTAEYFSFGELTSSEVMNLAAAAAGKTGRRYWILTTEIASATWTLDKANALQPA